MEPGPKAIEMFLSESDRIAPPTLVLEGIEALCSQLEAEIQSMCHGLGVVEQKLQDLAELPGNWKEEVQSV